MEKKIKQVHFQITRDCNLRCAFCGQWGKNGFFSDASGEEMSLDDWKRIISELEKYQEQEKISPIVTVWGGEPLVSPYFDEILNLLKEKKFSTEIITNGVLIDEHIKTIKNCVDQLYISLDGTKEVHDSIRGSGVFEKVKKNLKELNHSNITVMSVITPQLLEILPDFLDELNELGIKQLYLQDMIGLTSKEISKYKEWIKEVFDITATDINSWENNRKINFGNAVDVIFKTLNLEKYNYQIEHKVHIKSKEIHCMSPFKHAHIAWNGNVLYCTDFYDFSAGNVKENTLSDIFLNEKSERYRHEIENNNCITCEHCSWRCSER